MCTEIRADESRLREIAAIVSTLPHKRSSTFRQLLGMLSFFALAAPPVQSGAVSERFAQIWHRPLFGAVSDQFGELCVNTTYDDRL